MSAPFVRPYIAMHCGVPSLTAWPCLARIKVVVAILLPVQNWSAFVYVTLLSPSASETVAKIAWHAFLCRYCTCFLFQHSPTPTVYWTSAAPVPSPVPNCECRSPVPSAVSPHNPVVRACLKSVDSLIHQVLSLKYLFNTFLYAVKAFLFVVGRRTLIKRAFRPWDTPPDRTFSSSRQRLKLSAART